MVRDLEAAGDLLADSDLVAAIAGDAHAQQLVAAEPADSAHAASAADTPENDYSVLDADSSQRSAIDAVVAGRSLVIHGPPGTGKSQTIANLIAAMVARGRKVLFVAEKRAAIDAVLSRLVGVNLGDLVLDIHEGTRDRQRIAADLGATLDLAEHATAPDTTALHRRLTDRQQRLRRHATALHRVHQPWRLSAYQVQSALLGVPAEARVSVTARRPRADHPATSPTRSATSCASSPGSAASRCARTVRPGSARPSAAARRTRRRATLPAPCPAGPCRSSAARLAAACSETGLPPAGLSQLSERTPACSPLHTLQLGRAAGSGIPRAPRDAPGGSAEWQTLREPGRRGGSWSGQPVGERAAAVRVPGAGAGVGRVRARRSRRCGACPARRPGADPETATAALVADQETPWKLPRLHELRRAGSARSGSRRCSTRLAVQAVRSAALT